MFLKIHTDHNSLNRTVSILHGIFSGRLHEIVPFERRLDSSVLVVNLVHLGGE